MLIDQKDLRSVMLFGECIPGPKPFSFYLNWLL